MARIRYIKPTIGTDEDLAEVSITARYLFAILPTLCDKEGRCEDRPKLLKLATFPWDQVDVNELLEELAPRFIIRYEVSGKRFLAIRGFKKHQRPHPSEAPSEIPAPPTIEIKSHGKKLKNIIKNEIMSIKGDGDGEEGRGREVATAPKSERPPKDGRELKPIDKVMRAFKEAKNIDADDAAWDKLNFKRFARAAADVLKLLGNNPEAAIMYVLVKGQELDDCDRTSWGLEAIARAAATDARVHDFINGENNGPKNIEVGAARLDGPRRAGGTASARDLAGDALNGLHAQAPALAGPPEDQLIDDEPFA